MKDLTSAQKEFVLGMNERLRDFALGPVTSNPLREYVDQLAALYRDRRPKRPMVGPPPWATVGLPEDLD